MDSGITYFLTIQNLQIDGRKSNSAQAVNPISVFQFSKNVQLK